MRKSIVWIFCLAAITRRFTTICIRQVSKLLAKLLTSSPWQVPNLRQKLGDSVLLGRKPHSTRLFSSVRMSMTTFRTTSVRYLHPDSIHAGLRLLIMVASSKASFPTQTICSRRHWSHLTNQPSKRKLSREPQSKEFSSRMRQPLSSEEIICLEDGMDIQQHIRLDNKMRVLWYQRVFMYDVTHLANCFDSYWNKNWKKQIDYWTNKKTNI